MKIVKNKVEMEHSQCPYCGNDYLAIFAEYKLNDFEHEYKDLVYGRKYYCNCCKTCFEIFADLQSKIAKDNCDCCN